MIPFVQIQNVPVHVTPLGDGTLHSPFALLPHDQTVLGLSENEAFAQIFAQELRRSPAAAVEGLQQPLIGRSSSLAENEESGDADDTPKSPWSKQTRRQSLYFNRFPKQAILLML